MANPTLNMAIPLTRRLANRATGRAYLNAAWGKYTAQSGHRESVVYYVDAGALRNVGFADEIVSLRHTGWFTDREFQIDEETTRGVVYQLPGKDGAARYVAGYHYNGADDEGATLFFDTVYSEHGDDDKAKREAARTADEHARVAADKECDYQEEERERMRKEEEEETRLDNLADCHPPL
jgi:hypothetical protein